MKETMGLSQNSKNIVFTLILSFLFETASRTSLFRSIVKNIFSNNKT